MVKVRYMFQIYNKAFVGEKKAMHGQFFPPVLHAVDGFIVTFGRMDGYFSVLGFNQDNF